MPLLQANLRALENVWCYKHIVSTGLKTEGKFAQGAFS